MIGLSFPTLEELPYVPIIPENRIISPPAGRHSPSRDDAGTPESVAGDDVRHRIRRRIIRPMIDPSLPRRPGRSRVPSPRAGACLSSAAIVLALGLLAVCLGPASAQQPPLTGG